MDTNILAALRDCAAFIAVMHPRGEIKLPDGKTHLRASVWIEQEIAIATYIQRIEKRTLPVIAFIHESVGLEGIRSLLHLNPIRFSDESEVLGALAKKLEPWKGLQAQGVRVELKKSGQTQQDGHRIASVSMIVHNDTNERIGSYNSRIQVPSSLLKHWSSAYMGEVKSSEPTERWFERDESAHQGAIAPRSNRILWKFDYCPQCAAEQTREILPIASAIVSELVISAKVWIQGREYADIKTIKELGMQG